MKCPWAEDLADAKRVAVRLGLDFRVFDFENEYKQKVVDYMLAEFKKGHTPNPDIMCNQEIKFKLFYEVALEQGADFIATGHYAKAEHGQLKMAADENKDQTYFLYRISEDAIKHTLFPIGDMLKPDVKKLAAEKGLDNAYKKESMGVCFVGDVGMKDFLKEYLTSESDRAEFLQVGPIIEQETGKVLGYHDGAIFYTIGQRHGLDIGGGLPYYVVAKNMTKNIVYVSKNLQDAELWTKTLRLNEVILRAKTAKSDSAKINATKNDIIKNDFIKVDTTKKDLAPELFEGKSVKVRLRHRAKLEPAVIRNLYGDYNQGTATLTLEFEDEIKKIASGQSVVLYDGPVCLGGGIL